MTIFLPIAVDHSARTVFFGSTPLRIALSCTLRYPIRCGTGRPPAEATHVFPMLCSYSGSTLLFFHCTPRRTESVAGLRFRLPSGPASRARPFPDDPTHLSLPGRSPPWCALVPAGKKADRSQILRCLEVG